VYEHDDLSLHVLGHGVGAEVEADHGQRHVEGGVEEGQQVAVGMQHHAAVFGGTFWKDSVQPL
jgi:hypothetical protein